MDNLSAYKSLALKKLLKRQELAYSISSILPNLSPIELAWSKIKNTLRTIAAVTRSKANKQLSFR